ncbi:MAG: recombinase A [Myxococcota bacterium]
MSSRLKIDELRERLKAPLALARRTGLGAPPWLVRALPDGGFPSGITELCAKRALAGATLIAAQTIALAQREGTAICAWLDPEASLHAPGLLQQGVDLSRLLVVRPPRARLRAVAVRITRSGAMALVAVDLHPVGAKRVPSACTVDDHRWVRRLQLACEQGKTTVLLLTDARVKQSAPLPVALKLLLERHVPQKLRVTVQKERAGRVGQRTEVDFP